MLDLPTLSTSWHCLELPGSKIPHLTGAWDWGSQHREEQKDLCRSGVPQQNYQKSPLIIHSF